VRILHQITDIIEPWMNERLEKLVGIYAAAVKVYTLYKRHRACSDNAQCGSGPAAL